MELSTNKNTENRFNISSLKHQSIRIKYRNETASLIDNRNLPTDNQNSWKRVTTMLEQAAENTIGFVEKSKKSTNGDVKELSLLQRIMKNRI